MKGHRRWLGANQRTQKAGDGSNTPPKAIGDGLGLINGHEKKLQQAEIIIDAIGDGLGLINGHRGITDAGSNKGLAIGDGLGLINGHYTAKIQALGKSQPSAMAWG